MEFIKKFNNEINTITKITETILSKIGINKNTIIDMNKGFKIIGDITKEINNMNKLKEELSKMDTKEQLHTINAIIVNILNSELISNVLSEEQRNKLLELCNNEETMNIIIDMLSWVSNIVLNKLDTNNDGKISVEEATNCYTNCCLCITKNNKKGCSCYDTDGCCSCCTPCVKKTSKAWTCCLFTLCCAEDNEITIDSPQL
jgi:hypothetical protein